MAIDSLALNKALMLMYADNRTRIAKLRADIRADIKKASGESTGGGHFQTPFWADAKDHVLGIGDLTDATAQRIEENHRRSRLYPKLKDGFLTWWDEKRRWHNEPLELGPSQKDSTVEIESLEVTVKIQGSMTLKSGTDFRILVYPYFAEFPALPKEGGRVGLWLIEKALHGDFDLQQLRILDILRAESHSVEKSPLTGEEENIAKTRLTQVVDLYEDLKKEY